MKLTLALKERAMWTHGPQRSPERENCAEHLKTSISDGNDSNELPHTRHVLVAVHFPDCSIGTAAEVGVGEGVRLH
eukprot:3022305-Amphidinium_carterae.1